MDSYYALIFECITYTRHLFLIIYSKNLVKSCVLHE